MFGKEIIIGCPKCKKARPQEIGITQFYKYKGREMLLTYCYDCGNAILTPMYDVPQRRNIFDSYNKPFFDIGDKAAQLISKEMKCIYPNKMREEEIEKKLFSKLLSAFGEEIAFRYEYEFKEIIQKAMCKKLSPAMRLETYLFDDVKDECEQSIVICF